MVRYKNNLKKMSIATVLLFVINGVYFSSQPLIDLHGFRQTQTAVSSFWMDKQSNFFNFNYPLPVIGPPWTAPFEFPLFQILAALLYRITDLNLDQVGRLMSLSFALLTIFPLSKLFYLFGLSRKSFHFTLILIYSSAQYLYWSRTFLIETFSLFLALLTLYQYFALKQNASAPKLILFPVLITVSLLTKITTSLTPILLILVLESFHQIQRMRRKERVQPLTIYIIFSIAVGFVLFVIWVKYTDSIKLSGEISRYLTSQKLIGWNFGKFEQRFSKEFWIELIIKKNFLQNPITLLIILLLAFASHRKLVDHKQVLALLFLWFMPMFIFANLHIVHIYYQTENLIYLLILTALLLSTTITLKEFQIFSLGCAAVILNLLIFLHFYFPFEKLHTATNQNIALSQVIKRDIGEDEILIAAGKDWDSTIPYYSERAAVMIPDWLPNKDLFLLQNLFDIEQKRQIGAFLFCSIVSGSDQLNMNQILVLRNKWNLSNERNFGNCTLYTKQR